MKKNTRIAVLCMAAAALPGCSGGEEAGDALADAASGVAGTTDEMVGSMSSDIEGASMLKIADMKTKLFDQTLSTLKGITDVASAKQALPVLQDVVANIGAIKTRLSSLGATGGRSPVGGESVNALSGELQRIEQAPGVKAVIGKPLETIAGFFKGTA